MSDADSSAQPFASMFKAAVEQTASLSGGLTLQSVSTSRDGTHKLVFALNSGAGGAAGGNVETVLIPMRNRSAGAKDTALRHNIQLLQTASSASCDGTSWLSVSLAWPRQQLSQTYCSQNSSVLCCIQHMQLGL